MGHFPNSCGKLTAINLPFEDGPGTHIYADFGVAYDWLCQITWSIFGSQQITLLRVIPTMTFIGFVTGKSSDIPSGISSGILSDISSGIRSGILFGILSGISSGILSDISSGIRSDILSGISSGILSGRWGPAVHTELGRSQVEVQRCTLSWEGPRLRSSGAHLAGKVPGWGPAVHTELGSWQRAWRRELAKSLAKSWQGGSGGGSWCRHGRGETGGGGGGGGGEEEEEKEEEKS